MIDLGNRFIADDGTVVLTTQGAVEAMYAGADLQGCLVEPSEDTDLYQRSLRLLDLDLPSLATDSSQLADTDWYSAWLTPPFYQEVDVREYCLDFCDTDQQRERVCAEIKLFEDRHMMPVLRHLIWMVRYFRDNDIVWGVGRGSSVSSYVLFLIGINRINPLKFDLDVSEFLK
jgi:hypothetical protein